MRLINTFYIKNKNNTINNIKILNNEIYGNKIYHKIKIKKYGNRNEIMVIMIFCKK